MDMTEVIMNKSNEQKHGGKGSMVGVLLSILIILNLRNGMGLMNITGHMQTGVIGILLISSVLLPNLLNDFKARRRKDA